MCELKRTNKLHISIILSFYRLLVDFSEIEFKSVSIGAFWRNLIAEQIFKLTQFFKKC